MRIAAAALAVILTSCGVNAQADDLASSSNIAIKDMRTAAQKKERRDSIFSYVYVLADKSVKPAPVAQLRSYLTMHAELTDDVQLVVKEFYIVDVFQKRLKTMVRGNGVAGDLIYKTLKSVTASKALIENISVPYDQDSVVCLLAGTLNGQRVEASSLRLYGIGSAVVAVHSSQQFIDAVSGCIADLSTQLLAAMHAHSPAESTSGSRFESNSRTE